MRLSSCTCKRTVDVILYSIIFLSSMKAGKMYVGLTMNSKLSYIFIILVVYVCAISSSEVPRPRGVSLSRASLYPPDKDFTCFDRSRTIPFSQVNDDYCDCYDASDEPGTSACPHGIFHCTNAGHRPQNLAASRVNDGICDCCDGSDEYASGTKCINNCIELGRNAREAAQRRAELIKAGKQLKAEMGQQGVQLKQEKRTKLNELLKDKEEADKVKAEKEAIKKEAEDKENVALEYYRKLEEEAKRKKQEQEEAKTKAEALETFRKFDANQDGKVDIAEIQVRESFDKDRNGEVSEEEAKFFLNDQESVDVETFVSVCWTNVKSYLMIDGGVYTPPQPDSDNTNEEAEDMSEQEEADDEEAGEDEDDETDGEQHDEAPVPEVKPEIVYDDETKKLVETANAARNDFRDAEAQVRDLDNEIRNIREYLDKDFGPEEEFAILEGQCYEFEDHEYVYKLCPFDRAAQQPKSSGSETRLGTWGHWSGPESDKYSEMLYDRGQSCWNGPQRTATIRLHCGSDSKVTGVSEPNRCEYMFDFETPAACRELSRDEARDDLHDEL